MNFGSGGGSALKAWKDIWGAGQSVSGIHEIETVQALVERMAREYETARAQLQ
jgi:nitronate monooxygenase